MMNVMGRRFDQSAKQLLVGHMTVHDVSDVTRRQMAVAGFYPPGPILSVFSVLIVHSKLKSVHPGFPLAFIFLSTS